MVSSVWCQPVCRTHNGPFVERFCQTHLWNAFMEPSVHASFSEIFADFKSTSAGFLSKLFKNFSTPDGRSNQKYDKSYMWTNTLLITNTTNLYNAAWSTLVLYWTEVSGFRFGGGIAGTTTSAAFDLPPKFPARTTNVELWLRTIWRPLAS